TGMGGARCDGLTAVYPPFGTPSSAPCGYWIQQLSPISSAVGYQSHNAQNLTDPAPPAKLNSQLQLAISLGAHFIEVWNSDADDPVSAPVLHAANNQLLGR